MLKKVLSFIILCAVLLSACSPANIQNTQETLGSPGVSSAPVLPESTPALAVTPEPTPTATPKPILFTEIDFRVIKADVKSYISEEAVEGYHKLLDAVLAREEFVQLSDDLDTNLESYGAMQNNPLYFLVEVMEFLEYPGTIRFTYAYDEAEQERMKQFIEDEYLTLLNEIIEPGMNELDKVLAVYRYFALRISYNYNWLDALYAAEEGWIPDIEIYEALSTNLGVCHSYTYLCEFALQQLGIECLRFIGEMTEKDETHMWLVVRIDGEYYHCDPTWDSTFGFAGLRYFGMTDAERRESGVVNFENCYDASYVQIICDDERFSSFRDVDNFSFIGEHLIELETVDGTREFRTD
ncbi:MAG: hypothetical protein LBM18_05580 [Oscillospiraceae bacterium]|jgi:hypothetical protein|nr:hypothetical protein [Oscillospiraceae bacterium]